MSYAGAGTVTLIFWILALLVLQPFRMRLALTAFLIISHIDLSGTSFDSAVALGWENVFKSIVLPGWLALRGMIIFVRENERDSIFDLLGQIFFRRATVMWTIFCGYVAIAILPSPFLLAGLKLLGALGSHSLLFFAMVLAWRTKRLDQRVVLVALFAIGALGLIHTFVLGSPFSNASTTFYSRFTTFTSPQGFAEGLVPLASVLVWYPRGGAAGAVIAVGALVGGAFVSGSRIGFLGAVAAVAIWLLRRFDRRRIVVWFTLFATVVLMLLYSPTRSALLRSRIGELAQLSGEQKDPRFNSVSTFRWRLLMYECYASELREKTHSSLLFGSGTSSTGVAALACEAKYDPVSFSPNRVAHCEFIRAFWEWGVLGFLLVLALLGSLTLFALRCFVRSGRRGDPDAWHFGPLASTLPSLLLAITFENILQAAGAPGPVGVTLVLTQAVAASFAESSS